MHKRKLKIVICGIGTGGHYFPAIVVAKEFIRRNHEVVFLVRQGFQEEKIARMHNLNTFDIEAQPFYGKSMAAKLAFLGSFFYSFYRLGSITKQGVGFSFGGFGSIPLFISCFINRSPFYVFEPNAIPGRATRLVASHAKRVFLGMPIETKMKGKLMATGIPIREEFKKIRDNSGNTNTGRKNILFVGGSQGAKKLNSLALELATVLPDDYAITIISGMRDYEWVNQDKDSRTRVIPFTSQPWDEIRKADIIVSRSGALAGYEILAMNKRVLFIPFPFAIDNHQYYNGLYFTRVGNGTLVDEKGLTRETMIEKIKAALKNQIKKTSSIVFDAEKRMVDEVERGMV